MHFAESLPESDHFVVKGRYTNYEGSRAFSCFPSGSVDVQAQPRLLIINWISIRETYRAFMKSNKVWDHEVVEKRHDGKKMQRFPEVKMLVALREISNTLEVRPSC